MIYHFVAFWLCPSEGDRKGNCHPGLVVENEVTGPMKNDFYLQSHAAIQGSKLNNIHLSCQHTNGLFYSAPRSAHYIVLHDDIFNGNMQK